MYDIIHKQAHQPSCVLSDLLSCVDIIKL